MDQFPNDILPNLNKLYKIVSYNDKKLSIIVFWFDSFLHHEINLPIQNNKILEGYELEKYIIGFKPSVSSVKTNDLPAETIIPENKDYIKSLVSNVYSLDEYTINIKNSVLKLRQMLLYQSDFSQSVDFQELIADDEKLQWKKYRQKLRDLTLQSTFPKEVEWPQKPHSMDLIIYD